ncbi:MAG: four helix bundle protein, partial [Phycisphaerae bacterium]|nr:four helix bundle protein [Phycisphaerae bacterium]
MKTFRDLVVWQKGYQLASNVYQATSGFPGSERFGLTSQMRRCASSVPANIAEGFGRHRRKEFVRFLQIAQGSLFEIETYTCL